MRLIWSPQVKSTRLGRNPFQGKPNPKLLLRDKPSSKGDPFLNQTFNRGWTTHGNPSTYLEYLSLLESNTGRATPLTSRPSQASALQWVTRVLGGLSHPSTQQTWVPSSHHLGSCYPWTLACCLVSNGISNTRTSIVISSYSLCRRHSNCIFFFTCCHRSYMLILVLLSSCCSNGLLLFHHQ
jgi:hypothetical protein